MTPFETVAQPDPVVEVVHGVKITDPYRWLEDEKNPATIAFTEQQNAHTRAVLEALPGRDRIRKRFEELARIGFVNTPIRHGSRYFYTARDGLANQPSLYVRENGHDRVLLEPAKLSSDGTTALDWWYPSEGAGNLVAYGLSEGGNELSTLHVLDVATGQDVPNEQIPYTRFSSVAWLPDDSGFYYTRYPTPGSVPAGQEVYNRKVFLHQLGRDWHDDPLIYADDDPQGMTGVVLSPNGRYLVVGVSHGWARNDVYFQDLQSPDSKLVNLVEGQEGLFMGVMTDEAVYVLTNHLAPRYRVMKFGYDQPQFENWHELIPESTATIQAIEVSKGGLAVQTSENAISHLLLCDLNTGQPIGDEVPLPTLGTIASIQASPDYDEITFSFGSFAYPLTAYSYEPATRKLAVFGAPRQAPNLDPEKVIVKQEWYTSKDGTPVSIFVVYHKDTTLDGQRPTLLTGYGGFNVNRTPEFNTPLHVWIEQGGVWALPNLRGGGEYGEDWHAGGMLANKQNTFDDFIAAGEWLIKSGYTDSNRLAIYGGSNGGLLVGAAITQRPDLWRAAVCAVPLLDMVRYHQFRIARLWIPEYGSSEDEEQFGWLYAYSPYHHVVPGRTYPATLFTTAEGDSRVDPLHARKMAALLQAQAANDASRPILLRVESKAGHGAGKPLSKVLDESTDVWSFLTWQLSDK